MNDVIINGIVNDLGIKKDRSECEPGKAGLTFYFQSYYLFCFILFYFVLFCFSFPE